MQFSNLKTKHYLRLVAVLLFFSLSSCCVIAAMLKGSNLETFLLGKQLVALAFSLVVSTILFTLDFQILKRLLLPVAIITYLAFWGLFLFGTKINGARGWYRLGICSVQPSEIAKPAFILVLAYLCNRLSKNANDKRNFAILVALMASVAIPLVLQPDFGSFAVYALTFAIVVWCAGFPKWHFAILGLSSCAVVAAALYRFAHVRSRIFTYANSLFSTDLPVGYHAQRLHECFAKGSWTGAFQDGTVAMNQLPYRQSDSIFACFAEYTGIAGTIPLILLYLLWCHYTFELARKTQNTLYRLIYVGAGAMLTGQAFIHIAVNLNLIPNTGITLPLLSTGGSSLLATFIIATVVQRILHEDQQENNGGDNIG